MDIPIWALEKYMGNMRQIFGKSIGNIRALDFLGKGKSLEKYGKTIGKKMGRDKDGKQCVNVEGTWCPVMISDYR